LDLLTTHLLLENLTNVHLIEQSTSDRYRFHDLLRSYAASLARQYDSTPDREIAVKSLFIWYTHTAWICHAAAFPAHTRLPLQLPTPRNPTPIPDVAHALRWLDTEKVALLNALQEAARYGLHDLVVHLAHGLRFLNHKGAWTDLLKANRSGLSSARQIDDRVAESYFYISHGETLLFMQRWTEALTDLNQGLMLAYKITNLHYLSMALNALGLLLIEQGQFDGALEYLTKALPFSRGVDAGRTEAVIEGNLSVVHNGLQRYKEALVHGERSLALRRRAGDLSGEGHALHQLACAWNGLGNFHLAANLCRTAIAVEDGRQNLAHTVAGPLETLAESLEHLGHRDESVQCRLEAARLYDDYGYPWRARRIRDALERPS
ncbi:MAG: tetratricopeptide repeat protein, partial [Umezawaea sp.]